MDNITTETSIETYVTTASTDEEKSIKMPDADESLSHISGILKLYKEKIEEVDLKMRREQNRVQYNEQNMKSRMDQLKLHLEKLELKIDEIKTYMKRDRGVLKEIVMGLESSFTKIYSEVSEAISHNNKVIGTLDDRVVDLTKNVGEFASVAAKLTDKVKLRADSKQLRHMRQLNDRLIKDISVNFKRLVEDRREKKQ